jgi:hypothetical protein
LNDYQLFANGGADYGFYVGYDRAWVVRFPAVPSGEWHRAFIGAKLGGMKTERKPGRPNWDRRVVPGEIVAAVSPEPLWPQSRRYSLASTEDIPLAGDPDQALEGVGESRWFWAEVPVSALSTGTPNFVALFSPDEPLRGEGRNPVLAGARNEGAVTAWLCNDAQGQPPRTSTEAFRFPSGANTPAVAMKLVPRREAAPAVSLRRPKNGTAIGNALVVWASVEGTDVASAWVEVSADGRDWRRAGRSVTQPPYFFSIPRENLPHPVARVRVTAVDVWENRGASSDVQVKTGK